MDNQSGYFASGETAGSPRKARGLQCEAFGTSTDSPLPISRLKILMAWHEMDVVAKQTPFLNDVEMQRVKSPGNLGVGNGWSSPFHVTLSWRPVSSSSSARQYHVDLTSSITCTIWRLSQPYTSLILCNRNARMASNLVNRTDGV